jgi:hypothetical protein
VLAFFAYSAFSLLTDGSPGTDALWEPGKRKPFKDLFNNGSISFTIGSVLKKFLVFCVVKICLPTNVFV